MNAIYPPPLVIHSELSLGRAACALGQRFPARPRELRRPGALGVLRHRQTEHPVRPAVRLEAVLADGAGVRPRARPRRLGAQRYDACGGERSRTIR